MFEIKRTKLLDSYLSMIKKGHLLLIGDPGSGKSWLIEKAKQSLIDESVTTVVIKADEIHVENLSDFKNALGITERTIEEVLNYKSAGKRSILFIDALDAARSEVKQSVFRKFIQLILSKCPDWTVVASIRSYDAKHSKELLSAFPVGTSDAPEQFSKKDIPYRHLYVPKLTDEEIEQALEQASYLRAIYQSLSQEQKKLFRNPFSLWLFDKLASEGVPLPELSTVQRIVQLLGLYWEYRIEKKDDAIARKKLLKLAVQKMTETNLLSVNETDLFIPGAEGALKGLKSDHVIVSTSKSEQRFIFEHNVIFDYAVSRLMISEVPSEALEYLESNLRIPIFLRPSIEFFFSRLWYDERLAFWNVFWHFSENAKSRYVNMLPIITLVNEMKLPADFEPLIEKLSKKESNKTISLIDTTFKVFQSLKEEILQNRDEVWISFVHALLPYLNLTFIDSYVNALQALINKLGFWRAEDKVKLADCVQAILKWAWENPNSGGNNHEGLLRMVAARVIPLACEVYVISKENFRKILGTVLDRIGPKSVLTEIFSLVHNLDKIWLIDPDFVFEIYSSVFGYKETSTEETQMRGGVLSLLGNRRQDYDGNLYMLAEKYPKYLKNHPVIATRAMVVSVNKGVKLSRRANYLNEIIETFAFGLKTAKFIEDGSDSYDKYSFREEDHLRLLTSFKDYLSDLIKNNQFNESTFMQILNEIIDHNEVAVVWRYVLKLARSHPEKIINKIHPLLVARPILLNPSTSFIVGDLLNKHFHLLPELTRKEIESAILNLPKEITEKKERIEYFRNRLLACIPKVFLSESESRAILEELEKTNKVPKNESGFGSSGGFSSHPYTEKQWLKDEGVDVSQADNKWLLKISEEAKEFADKNLNTNPTLKDGLKALSPIKALYEALNDSTKNPDEKVRERALTHVTAAISRILRNDEVFANDEILNLAHQVLELSRKSEFPRHDKKHDDDFDHPSWGPAPRIEAAEAIMLLVRRKELATAENLSIVEELADDPVPAVRYQIAQRIVSLYYANQDKMWSIAESIAKKEKTSGVLMALASSLSRLAGKHTDRVLDLFDSLCKKMTLEKRKKSGVHNDPCLSTYVGLFVVFGNERANSLLKEIEKFPVEKADELSQVTISAINYLSSGLNDKEKEGSEETRSRTRLFLARTLQASKKGFEALNEKFKNEWPEERRESAKKLYEIVDIVARWLSFKQEDKYVTKDNREQFYKEIKPLIWEVISVAKSSFLHASTAHNLMEMCNKCLSYDPAGIIEIAEAVCQTSEGYALDSMAIGRLVELVENYLADYKDLLRDETNLRHLTNLLEIFIVAGWPQAIQLAITLDKIWR